MRTLHTCPPAPPPRPAPSIQSVPGPPTLARALLASTFATFQRTETLESRRRLALTGGCDAPRAAPSLQGVGKQAGFRPFTEAVVIGSTLRHSAFRQRGGGGARAGRGVTGGEGAACEPRAPARGGSHRFGAREAWARAASTRAKVLGGAAGGAETQALLQEQRPAPAAAPAAVSGPRASGVPAHRGSPPPLARSRSARNGPAQECQGRRRQQQ